MPNPSPQSFCNYLRERLGIKTNLSNIFIADNFTLRELQKILPQIKLLEKQHSKTQGIENFDIEHAIFILLLKIYKPDLYMQLPNITDAKGIMEIVEKIACKETAILDKQLFMYYVEIVYSLCKQIYNQDYHFWREQESSNEGKVRDFYSYIVKTYCAFFNIEHKKLQFPISINSKEITNAINFISQFDIQDS